MARILIIEDEAGLASALGSVARRLGCDAELCASGAYGLERFFALTPALVILDIGLPDRNGLEVLAAVRQRDAAVPVLVITAHGNLANAVEAKKRGASGYLVKPLDLGDFEKTLQGLIGSASLAGAASSNSSEKAFRAPLLIGSAPAMQPAFAAIAHAAASDAPVLITGPTGIGKSLAARVIHLHSPRHTGPFVTLSCASLPEALLEAELFGHEKGAFTGAIAARAGHVERAAGGTLLLDEVAEIPPAVQVKLLRLVEEKTFTRVGGREDVPVNLRIMAATNRDLAQAVAEKKFREDLLYRLRVLEVKLPPLCKRMSDLPALCSWLLAGFSNGRTPALAKETLAVLGGHDWPGNVRELRNALEHAAAVSGGAVILPQHLPENLRKENAAPALVDAELNAALRQWLDRELDRHAGYDAIHDELEGRLLEALLPRFEGKPTLLARALDMNRATLRKKLRISGLRDPEE
jgi:DNA-binding NtrC family response regulator